MTNTEIEVLPDSYIRHKMKQAVILAVFFTAFGAFCWALLEMGLIGFITGIILSAIVLVFIFYCEYLRRPMSLQITNEGVTLFFKRLKPRAYSWNRISAVAVLGQIPKMRGVMPTRGGFELKGRGAGYFLDEDAARAIVKAYTEIFGHPPRVKDASDDCVFWEINPA